MKKKLSASQLAVLKKEGARVSITKEAPPPPPKPKSATDRLLESQTTIANRQEDAAAKATAALLAQIGNGNTMLAEKLAAITIPKPDAPKPVPYRFTIIRDAHGLIESVDAHPIED